MLKKRFRTTIAFSIAFLILFILIISEGFIITHINHHCTGKECSICAEMHIVESSVQQLSMAFQAAISITVFFIAVTNLFFKVSMLNLITPIKMKVRLNN